MQPVEVVSPSGLFLGRRMQVRFNAEPHDQGIRKITRGLFFHHFGRILPFDTSIDIGIVDTSNSSWSYGLSEIIPHLKANMLGDLKVFQYRFGNTIEDPDTSFWLYTF